MEYKTKSLLISRTTRKESKHPDPEGFLRPCTISLFDENDPHKKGLEPKKIIRFDNIHKIIIEEMKEVNYLLSGNDILLNNLYRINIKKEGPHIRICYVR